MRCPWWSALILTGLIVSAALGASESDDLERNRRLLERWSADPDHRARLLRDLRAFHALPPPRQQLIRALDQQLHEANAPTQGRLWAALERYNVWLETLTDEQRRHLATAPDAATRLARIRELRLREWLPRLPEDDQQAVSLLPEDEQPERIAALRAEERSQRGAWYREWLAAEAAIPRPTKLSELPAETKAFVEANLLKRLKGDEQKELRKVEGKYPEWLRLLEKLSEAHPVLPPLPSGEVKSFDDLNKVSGAEKLAKKYKGGGSKHKGQWPEFALMLSRIKWEKVPPLGASRPDDFPPEIEAFLTNQLFPALSREQRTLLDRQEGHWPEYPRILLHLAREHHLPIPGMSLPGPAEMWENARAEAALPLDGLLNGLAERELTPIERAQIEFRSGDVKGNLEKLQNALKRKIAAEIERKLKRGHSH